MKKTKQFMYLRVKHSAAEVKLVETGVVNSEVVEGEGDVVIASELPKSKNIMRKGLKIIIVGKIYSSRRYIEV